MDDQINRENKKISQGSENILSNNEENLSDGDVFAGLEFSAFAKFGVIGDSLSVGYTHHPLDGAEKERNLYYSWGQFMARRMGNTCLNFGKSGITTKSWFTDPYCNQEFMKEENLCQAYIVALGVNDSAPVHTQYVPLGGIEDVNFSDMDKSADTVCVWYARLLKHINETAEDAKIFVMTIPYWRNRDKDIQRMNQLIRTLAARREFKNVFLVDLDAEYDDYFKSMPMVNEIYAGGHYSVLGYNYMSKIHEIALSRVMREHYEKFRDIPFIPYGENNRIL